MSSSHTPRQRLLAYARPHRGRIWTATLWSVTNKLLDLAPPALIGLAVDVVVEREGSFLGRHVAPDPVDQIWVLAGLTVLVWVLESVTEYLEKLWWRNLAQTLQHELRLDAYGHVQKLDLGFFEDRTSGGLMAVVNDDVNQLERFLDRGPNDIVQVITTVLAIGTYYFWVEPRIAWMAMAPMPFILIGSIWWQKRLAPRYAVVREEVALLNGELSGNLGGIATIKAFTAEEREVERIGGRSEAYRAANRAAIRFSSAFSPLIRMVIVLGFTATMVKGGQLVLDGELAVASYTVIIYLTQRLLWPLTRLGETFDQYQRAMASAERVLDLMEVHTRVESGPVRLARDEVRGAVELRNVEFHYPNGFRVFENLSLSVAPGETTAIVGSTGSGKSTLIKLLLRFYDVTGGAFLLDGRDVRELDLHDLRHAVGMVSQDVFVFHGSVRDNIAYGKPDATLEEVREAARVAEADEFVMALPNEYDTLIGERGQKLSGGQRQRLSIARAVLSDSPILVLDEATSAVDNETEAAIQRSLARVSEGRTTIAIAHRLSTIRNAHRIHVLDEGRLVEHGTHEELLAKDGVYAGLWRVQTGEGREVDPVGAG